MKMEKTERLIEMISGQMPEVAQQILYHNKVMAIVWAIVGMILIAGGIFLLKLGLKYYKEANYSSPEVPCFLGAGLAVFIGASMICVSIHTLWICYTMPNLVLLDHVLSGLGAK
jgi:hypothetical protein